MSGVAGSVSAPLIAPGGAWINPDGTPTPIFSNLIQALYNRTGGTSGSLVDSVARSEAETAQLAANAAQSQANSAQVTANGAQTTANTAQTAATSAGTAAATAQTAATGAQTTANAAQTTANNAVAKAGGVATLTVALPAGQTTAQTLAYWFGPVGMTVLFKAWMATLPTTLPGTSGVVWNNAGVPTIS